VKQFDICRNLGRGRAARPYFVVVQSNRFAGLVTRLVVPLLMRDTVSALAGTVQVQGVSLAFDPVLMFAIGCEKLGPVVGFLNESSKFAVIAAIDVTIESGYR
jgi:hypothetical protein